jgi:protein-S-isoprenylcysteine O-methyltransferase Ste14
MEPYYGWPDPAADTIWAIWSLWVVSWLIAAAWTSHTAARPARGSQFLYRVLTFGGGVLLFARYSADGAYGQLWTSPPLLGWAMVAVTIAGFAFCWWARLYLGKLWSGSVTRKDDHHIVDTGPYAQVRHPIYTGIIVASLAAAIERGAVTGFVGFAVMTLGWWVKARLEESFLRAELGADAYDAYARRTGMLIPHFLPPMLEVGAPRGKR